MSRLGEYIDATYQNGDGPPPLPALPGGGGGGETYYVPEGPWAGYTWSQLLAAFKAGQISEGELRNIAETWPITQGGIVLGPQAFESALVINRPTGAAGPTRYEGASEDQLFSGNLTPQEIYAELRARGSTFEAIQQKFIARGLPAPQRQPRGAGAPTAREGLLNRLPEGEFDVVFPQGPEGFSAAESERLTAAGLGPPLTEAQLIAGAKAFSINPDDVWNALQAFHGYTPQGATTRLLIEGFVDSAGGEEGPGVGAGGAPAGPAGGALTPLGPEWANFDVTQEFGPGIDLDTEGYWINPETGQREYLPHLNKGLDLGTPEGTPITANRPGIVEAAGDQNDGWGISVKVRDNEGNLHNYGHLSSANVQPGQQVTPGMVLGASGSTGVSTGPHLSYDVQNPQGDWIDPRPFVTGGAEGGAPAGPAAGGALQVPGYDPQAVATLTDAAQQAGFTGDALNRAVATALAESGGNFAATNKRGENSISAWQINLDAHADKVPGATLADKEAWLKDPYNAAQMAFQISSGGTDWSPWTVWHENRGAPAQAVYSSISGGAGGAAPTGVFPGSRFQPPGGSAPEVQTQLEQLDAAFRAGKFGTGPEAEAAYYRQRKVLEDLVRSYTAGPLEGMTASQLIQAVADGELTQQEAEFQLEQSVRNAFPATEFTPDRIQAEIEGNLEAFRTELGAEQRKLTRRIAEIQERYPQGIVGIDKQRADELSFRPDEARRQFAEEFGRQPTLNELTTWLGQSIGTEANVEIQALRAAEGVLEETGGRFVPQSVIIDGQRRRLGEMQQGLLGLPAPGQTLEPTSYINEQGQLVREERPEAPRQFTRPEQYLFEVAPGLFTGDSSYAGQAQTASGGVEAVPQFSGIPFDPTDPNRGARIQSAIEEAGGLEGAPGLLGRRDRQQLAKVTQQARLTQEGDPEAARAQIEAQINQAMRFAQVQPRRALDIFGRLPSNVLNQFYPEAMQAYQDLQRQQFGIPGFAEGGTFMAEEPIVGVGLLSGRPRFMIGEEGKDEKLKITPTDEDISLDREVKGSRLGGEVRGFQAGGVVHAGLNFPKAVQPEPPESPSVGGGISPGFGAKEPTGRIRQAQLAHEFELALSQALAPQRQAEAEQVALGRRQRAIRQAQGNVLDVERSILQASQDPQDLINVERARRQRAAFAPVYGLAGLQQPQGLVLPAAAQQGVGPLPPGMFFEPLTQAEQLEQFVLPEAQLAASEAALLSGMPLGAPPRQPLPQRTGPRSLLPSRRGLVAA